MINLCSKSETRAKILRDRGIEFFQSESNFDEESIEEKNPKSFVYQATIGKYRNALKSHGFEVPLLVADTVVEVGGEILRKATSESDARRLLDLQSGSDVSIITCMILKKKGFEMIDISATVYRFAKFDRDDIEAYMQSGEWSGKAGACMVEGFCKKYIEETIGYESCAMGLSVEKLLPYI